MNQCPPGSQVFHWSHFEFFRKIRGDIRELLFITGVNVTGNKLFSGVNDTLPVSLTPAINLCHGFSVIARVVDTGEQFITGDNDTGNNFVAGDNDTGDNFVTGDNDTGEQLSTVTTTPAINSLPVTRTRTHGGGELPRIGES
jgi:hypothetical protein